MSLQSSDTRSSSRVIRVAGADNSIRDVCHISSSIKDGRSVTVSVLVVDTEIAAQHACEVQDQVMDFVYAAFSDAAATGIPVRACGEGD